MRLYSLADADQIKHEDTVYKAAEDGGFDLPEELGEFLRSSAAGGRKQWETDAERSRRLVAEEIERRKDPATLLAVVEQIMGLAEAGAGSKTEAPSVKAKAAAAK